MNLFKRFERDFTYNKKYVRENPHNLWISPKEKWLWILFIIITILAMISIDKSAKGQTPPPTYREVVTPKFDTYALLKDKFEWKPEEYSYETDTVKNIAPVRYMYNYTYCSGYRYSKPHAIVWYPNALPIIYTKVRVQRTMPNMYRINVW